MFKYYFSIHLDTLCKISKSKTQKREKGIWQRRYWEHTIRDEKDLNKHLDYIHYNSYKHYEIKPQDWSYSSFNKFVEKGFYEPDWCNFNDINNIIELNYE